MSTIHSDREHRNEESFHEEDVRAAIAFAAAYAQQDLPIAEAASKRTTALREPTSAFDVVVI